jgi:hypothetical protein
MGERPPRHGSKPARTRLIDKRCPRRAEFFAPPHHGPAASGPYRIMAPPGHAHCILGPPYHGPFQLFLPRRVYRSNPN